ncbi:uncharacterized protein PG998_000205 [Apiospora kogelbergensis]|uniref:Peptidase inhibitor family I36 n=1 Tax=Apiospora kogelbergensis TaxID=1337665 RepID=A0AAW0QXX0_9PEZI
MRASTVFATLAATAAATPVAIRAADYQWDVTEWDAGCNNDDCSYEFQITGAATGDYPARPAFSAACQGASHDGNIATQYAPCTIKGDGVKGTLVSRLNKPAELLGSRTVVPIQVSFQFADLTQDNTYWNYTGAANTTFNRGGFEPLSFTIKPTESFGIA